MSNDEVQQPGRSMFSLQRRERLMDELRAHGSITVRAIAADLGVSELTIRRDVNALAEQGVLSRVHGGAVLPSSLGRGASEPVNGNRHTFGMVVPSLDYYWPQVISGARAEAEAQGVRLIVRGSSYDAEDNRRQVQALLAMEGMSGIIVAPETAGEPGHDLLRWLNSVPLPVVLAERRSPAVIPAHRLEWVATDHAFGAGMAVRHLWQEGHRVIGCLTDPASPTSRHVVRGWRQAVSALGTSTDAILDESAGNSGGPRTEQFNEILSRCRKTGTTGLLVHSDTQAVALVQHCRDLGVAVPGELAVVAYDDEVAYLAEPAISAVRPAKHYVGRVAVQMLAARIAEGRRRPVHRLELNPDLIVRDSSLGTPHPTPVKVDLP